MLKPKQSYWSVSHVHKHNKECTHAIHPHQKSTSLHIKVRSLSDTDIEVLFETRLLHTSYKHKRHTAHIIRCIDAKHKAHVQQTLRDVVKRDVIYMNTELWLQTVHTFWLQRFCAVHRVVALVPHAPLPGFLEVYWFYRQLTFHSSSTECTHYMQDVREFMRSLDVEIVVRLGARYPPRYPVGQEANTDLYVTWAALFGKDDGCPEFLAYVHELRNNVHFLETGADRLYLLVKRAQLFPRLPKKRMIDDRHESTMDAAHSPSTCERVRCRVLRRRTIYCD